MKRWRTRKEFARASGLGVRTISDIEYGRRSRYLPATLVTIEVALGWELGSCENIVKGGRPTPARDAGLELVAQAWQRMSPDARDLVVRLAMMAASSGW